MFGHLQTLICLSYFHISLAVLVFTIVLNRRLQYKHWKNSIDTIFTKKLLVYFTNKYKQQEVEKWNFEVENQRKYFLLIQSSLLYLLNNNKSLISSLITMIMDGKWFILLSFTDCMVDFWLWLCCYKWVTAEISSCSVLAANVV